MVDARTPGYGYLGDEVLGEPDVNIEKFGNGGYHADYCNGTPLAI